MEMGVIDVKDVPGLLYGHTIRALNGCCLWARALLLKTDGCHSIRSEAERRAENARQNYSAQALASWQAFRFMR